MKNTTQTSDASSVLKHRTMTAREMALTSHNLSRDGSFATLKDGRIFVWDSRFNHWARWK